MKNRSRNNSLDQSSKTNNKERTNSMDFYIHSGSEKSTRSYSIGSIDSIYLVDEEYHEIDNKEEDKYPVLTLRDSHGVPKVNKNSQPNNLYHIPSGNRVDILEQGTNKQRKRDVYICDIGESPKPSKFIEYMRQLVKHK
jgi:hypothetical protein